MTVEEMQSTLTRLGVEYYSVRNYEIQAECPAHEERTGHKDRHPSFYINADTGAFICFSCGWKGSIYTLINYVDGTIDAKDWLSSASGLSVRLQRAVRDEQVLEEQTHITESMLSAFTKPPAEALISRGITEGAAAKYGILWSPRSELWIIPIRNPKDNRLIGWQEKGYRNRFFRNYPAGVKKSVSLFGFEQYQGGDMIIVESPLDVARLYSVGIEGGVATYGSKVSDSQFNIIRGADRIVFAMDNDTAGVQSSLDLLDNCKVMGAEAWFFNYGDTDIKDIGGMSLKEIEYGLQTAKHMMRGKKAVHE